MILTVYTLIRSGSVIRSLPGVYRPPIGPLATVAKFPWKWYDFLPIPRSAKLQKKKAQE